MKSIEFIEPLGKLLAILDRLELRYTIGGSVASSVHGVSRSTNDVDIVADVQPEDIPELVRLASTEFVIDADTIRSALFHGRSFNVIHIPTAYKLDIFPVKAHSFESQVLARGQYSDVPVGEDAIECSVATAEDIILAKLRWFRRSNSEQQWRDLLGVARRQQGKLDLTYLYHWANELEVTPLLDKLLADAPRR